MSVTCVTIWPMYRPSSGLGIGYCEVVVKTKYLQRFSPQNYAWLLDYIYTKTPYMIKLKREMILAIST